MHKYVQDPQGNWHYVDCANTFDRGWEVMSFPADGDHGDARGEGVTSWQEELVEWPSFDTAAEIFNKVCRKIEKGDF